MKIGLIYRKKETKFNSIENVFNALLPELKLYAKKIELPYSSKGFKLRRKNILWLKKYSFDLYHITGHDHYLLLSYAKRRTILTIHDIEILKRTKGLRRWLLKKLWFDWPIRRAKVITTISEFSKTEILSLNNYRTPIKVISNPITLPIEFSPKTFNESCPIILQLGCKSNKNIFRLIEALKNINCRLVIVGKITDELQRVLDTVTFKFDVKENLTNSEIIEEYRNCDLVTFVSTYEGFGLPIIEAQAMGRVVITSNLASMPEVSGEAAILVNPYKVEDIRNAILRAIEDSMLREQLIKKGLENIKRFSPKKISQQYCELYHDIFNEK